MKIDKKVMILGVIVLVIILAVFFVLRREKGNEEQIADEGQPVGEGIDYVKEQQTAVMQALELYQKKRAEGMEFSSQCLGLVGDKIKYAIDIVNVPRNEEDDKPENQCEDYRGGRAKNFIELDKDGNIFRIG